MTTPNPRGQHPSQASRYGVGEAAPYADTVDKVVREMSPEPNRMELRPACLDRWGRMSLAGNEGDRLVVPSGGGSLAGPIICAVVGYLVVNALAR